ncbi:MAG: TonB-dependent receptor [Candidatus Pelagadaptatus aseana]|uniref:TonB-dependent receptor plug domain-containing protein n=1 Tax=Candidatus Pelagadaptatus aseana TaxID=3120508 RepID=UPI0039B20120
MPVRQVGTSVSVLDAADIEARGYSSVADVLRTQPAIGVSNSGGQGKATALRIRGEEGYRTLVLMDGVEISDPTGTQVGPQIQHLMSAGISRIEILRGPQGMMYGADAGGVINITTGQVDEGLAGGFTAETGRYGTEQYSGYLGAGNELGDVYISVSDYQTDGFSALKSDASKDEDGYDNETYHVKVGLNLNEQWRLQGVYRDVSSISLFDSTSGSNNRKSNYDEKTYRVSLNYSGEVFSHTLAVANTDVLRENFADGVSSFATNGDIDKLEYLGSAKLSEVLSLVYGAESETEEITTSSGDVEQRDQLSGYLELQSQFDNRLFFTAGVRHDDNDDFGEHTSYRLTSAYVVDFADGSMLKYKASYGTGFRAPSLSEIAYNNGPFAFAPASETTLTEETSEGFDVGIEYVTADNSRIELVYFDQEIKDELYFDLSGFSGYLQAEGISRSKGVEASLDSPITDRLNLFANYTYNDSHNPDGENRIRRPVHLANLGVNYDIIPSRWSVTMNVRASRDAENEIFGVGYVELDDYEVIDISTNFQVTDYAEVYARVENATDEDYEEVTGYNVAGAAAYAGVRMKF